MCSGFERRRVTASVAAMAAAVALSACQAGPAPEARAGTRELIESPVGPLPGPQEARRAAPNPVAGDERALADGRRFFLQYNCAGCHGDHGGGGMGPSLRDEAWIYGSADEDIADSIVEGRAHGMPAWGKMLTPSQVWQIAAYIKSMRTADEPQPPIP